jgi:hypothetical protein
MTGISHRAGRAGAVAIAALQKRQWGDGAHPANASGELPGSSEGRYRRVISRLIQRPIN